MLRSVTDLREFTIGAKDGTIGSVEDFYFDDDAWVVRYIVVRTGAWLVGREVLISPYSVGAPDAARKALPVSITKDQVKNSPSIDNQKPVSRQQEIGYLSYYGYPYYWGGTGLWGGAAYPGAMLADVGVGVRGPNVGHANGLAEEAAAYSSEDRRRASADPHLRSCEAVKGYHIHATDGDIGHVEGFLVDDRTWAVRYLIVNTSNWWLGHDVLVAPAWIGEVSWMESKVTTTLNRQQIKDAPVYDSLFPLSRGAEEGIYRHYGRQGYWHDRRERDAA